MVEFVWTIFLWIYKQSFSFEKKIRKNLLLRLKEIDDYR